MKEQIKEQTVVGNYTVEVSQQENGSYKYVIKRADGSILEEEGGYHDQQAAFVFGGMAAAFVTIMTEPIFK